MKYQLLRENVYRTTMNLCEAGLIRLLAGNISARDQDAHVAITPNGLEYARLKPEDIVIVDFDGRVVDGQLKPSSETPMHTTIYAKLPQVGAVVHTHSPYAMALASSVVEIPVICLEILSVGGPVPVVPYACPGSRQAGIVASECLSARPELKALMLRNHGLVAIGDDLEQAFVGAFNCEIGAQVYWIALQTGHPPVPLTDIQIEEIHQVYQTRR
ncbi:MAG: hypothetical protein A2136_10020 [Chloroflexi bacterium RBG_16_54_11]|nr:MAG: hypothetical protein A2136_10020 [Chloroflexi bacterium RBG_16_54_11]